MEIELSFETRFLTVAALLVSLFLLNGLALFFKKRRAPSETDARGTRQEKQGPSNRWQRALASTSLFFWQRKLGIFNISAVLCITAITGITLTQRPIITLSTPTGGECMSSGDQAIEIEFSLPVDTRNIMFNMSPEVKGRWEFEQAIPHFPLKRKARFHPEESFFPGRKVVIYVAGIRSPWSRGKLHEEGFEFFSPKIPGIEAVTPDDQNEHTPVDSAIEVQYDAPVGKFVKLEYRISPDAAFELEYKENPGKVHELKFLEPLSQDQEYTIEVYRTPRSYRVDSDEDIELGITENIKTWGFKTVTTPHTISYEPQGNSVATDAVIRVVFDQEVDRESVEERFEITPYAEGEVSWEDDQTFLFTPDSLDKETKYEVSFKKGFLSGHGGVTTEDIKITFETVGKVAVAGFSPISGAHGLDPTTTNIVVEFNQPVDHASAQQHFSISPLISGSFGWDGDKMIYYTAGKLSYSTRYDIKIGAGVKTVYGLDSVQDFTSYFVTKSRVFTLNVPQYYQQLPEGRFDCNLTATRMALAYRGIGVTDSQIKSTIGIGQNPDTHWVVGYGIHAGPIANYISSQGRSTVIKTGWNVTELAQEIEKGNPVILWWYNRWSSPTGPITLPGGYTGYNGMHSEVVRGFIDSPTNPTSLLTNDPWRGPLTYSQSLFLSTWAYLGYTAIVVY